MAKNRFTYLQKYWKLGANTWDLANDKMHDHKDAKKKKIRWTI